MKPHEILTDKEFYEPETIRALFPELSEIEIEQIQVLQAMTYNMAFWMDLFVFENAVLALNGIKPEIGFMQGTTPEQIWYAVRLATIAFPDREFDYEIKQYTKFICHQHGVYIYPPGMFKDEENPLYSKVKARLDAGTPLGETFIDIQAAKLGNIELYIRLKQDEEKMNAGLEKSSASYVAASPEPIEAVISPEIQFINWLRN